MKYEIDLEIAGQIFAAAKSDAGNLLTELEISGKKSLSLQGTSWTNEDRLSLLMAARAAINKKPLTEKNRLMRRFERLEASWRLFDAMARMRELPHYTEAVEAVEAADAAYMAEIATIKAAEIAAKATK